MTRTDTESTPSQAGSPFVHRIDSSVDFGGGIWFSSDKWAIKISTDRKDVLKPCRPFYTKGYWEALTDQWGESIDSCAYTPALGRVVGFWLFKDTKCIRVNTTGDDIIEGPGEIESLWPKLKGTAFGNGLNSCVYLDETPTSARFLILTTGKSSKDQKVGYYTRTEKRDDHRFEEAGPLYKVFPRLEGKLNDAPVTSILQHDHGKWFFFGHEVFKYSDLGGSGDRGPGDIGTYFPALKTAACSD